jgi:dolichol-phosphate mannosyltransferase
MEETKKAHQENVNLDIVIPVYNEESCIEQLILKLELLQDNFLKIGVNLHTIFVNDGSTDKSLKLLLYLKSQGSLNMKIINFTRNFGHQSAVCAGFVHSNSEYTAIMDADLQDPPEVLFEMFKAMKDGDFHVVYGKRVLRKGDSAFKRFSAWLFYRIIRVTTGVNVPLDAGDFRIVSKSVRTEINNLPERLKFTRILVPWLGFNSLGFDFERHARFAGKSKYPLKQMLQLASHTFFSFSTLPLRLVQLSIGIALIGAISLNILSYLKIFAFESDFLLLMLITLVLINNSLILGYVFRIQNEVYNRPRYIVERII